MRINHFRMLSAEAEEEEGDNAADNVDNNEEEDGSVEEEDGSVADEEGADNYGGMGPTSASTPVAASTATATNE